MVNPMYMDTLKELMKKLMKAEIPFNYIPMPKTSGGTIALPWASADITLDDNTCGHEQSLLEAWGKNLLTEQENEVAHMVGHLTVDEAFNRIAIAWLRC